MQIIDFHTHEFPDNLAPRALAAVSRESGIEQVAGNGTRQGLLEEMAARGVSKAVTLPVATRPVQVGVINEQVISNRCERIFPFGAIHPDSDTLKVEIDRLKQAGVPGVKLHPEFQQFAFDDPSRFELYDLLCNAGLIVVVHAGINPGPVSHNFALPAASARVARQFPKLKLVLAHMGGLGVWEQVIDELAATSVMLDTSATQGFMTREAFMAIVRAFGAQRILFGSDWPWFDLAKSIDWIDSMKLSSGEKEQILAANARSLLGC